MSEWGVSFLVPYVAFDCDVLALSSSVGGCGTSWGCLLRNDVILWFLGRRRGRLISGSRSSV